MLLDLCRIHGHYYLVARFCSNPIECVSIGDECPHLVHLLVVGHCCCAFLPQRAVLKFAGHTGSTSVAGRFTPGTFTNQIQKAFKEPRILIVSDPKLDHQVSILSIGYFFITANS